jgi:hypothetical protein
MVTKLTRLTYKIAIQLHLVAVPFAVLAPGGQFGNFWIHPPIMTKDLFYQVCVMVRPCTFVL